MDSLDLLSRSQKTERKSIIIHKDSRPRGCRRYKINKKINRKRRIAENTTHHTPICVCVYVHACVRVCVRVHGTYKIKTGHITLRVGTCDGINGMCQSGDTLPPHFP